MSLQVPPTADLEAGGHRLPAEVEFTEDATTLYRLYRGDGQLLYVGITNNVRARFAQHAASQDWWPQVARKTVASYGTRAEALRAEERAIKSERPVHNIVHGTSAQGPVVCYWYDDEWWRVVGWEEGWSDPAHRHVAIQSMSGNLVHAHIRRLGGRHRCEKNLRKCRVCDTVAGRGRSCDCISPCWRDDCGDPGSHRHHSNPCCEAERACRYVVVEERACQDCPAKWDWPESGPVTVVAAKSCGLGWPEPAKARPPVYVVTSASRPADTEAIPANLPAEKPKYNISHASPVPPLCADEWRRQLQEAEQVSYVAAITAAGAGEAVPADVAASLARTSERLAHELAHAAHGGLECSQEALSRRNSL